MILKTSTVKEQENGLITGFLVGSEFGDIINNLINNYKKNNLITGHFNLKIK